MQNAFPKNSSLETLKNILIEVLSDELQKTKSDIRMISDIVSCVCPHKIVVCGKEFEENELLENMNACFDVLRKNSRISAEKKLRSAKFCREAAINLQPKNAWRVIAVCDTIIRTANGSRPKQVVKLPDVLEV